jgi:thiamine-phosphate pyrophosphorylase
MPAGARLHAIVDVDAARRARWSPLDLAAAYLNGGARVLQVRAKSLAGSAFLDLAARVVELARAAGAAVVVNDRADIARLSKAAGVHVGQDDLVSSAARSIVGPAAIVGVSTHTETQLRAAIVQPVTYVAIGPVYGTSTKATGYAAVGVNAVRLAATLAQPAGLHVVAIGGITCDRVLEVLRSGATAVAVITDLLVTDDPERRVREYVARIGDAGKV